MLLKDMVSDGYYPSLVVDPAWYEGKHPQESLPEIEDPVALWRPAPERDQVGSTFRPDGGLLSFGFALGSPTLDAVSPAGDPDFADVIFLFDAEGTNGGTDTIDHSSFANAITYNGGIVLSNVQAKFGNTSLFNNNVSTDFIFTLDPGIAQPDSFDFSGGEDFTIEMWIYAEGSSGANNFARTDNSGAQRQWNILLSNGNYFLQYSINGTGYVALDSGHNVVLNTWQHFALVRDGNNYDLYQEGIKGATLDLTAVTLNSLTAGVAEMRFCEGLDGYLDEIRVTRGVARYTSNFTPPTAPFLQF